MKTILLKLIVLALLAIPASRSKAAAFSWTGAGTGIHQDLWSDSLNWSAGGPPAAADTASFGSITGGNSVTPTVSTPRSITSITFVAGAPSYTITGTSTLTIGGAAGIVNNSSLNQSFTVSTILLGAAQTWNADTANLSISSAINNNGKNLTIGGSGDTLLSGAISGSGFLQKTSGGTGTLTLSGNNTYTGATLAVGGTLVAASSGAFGSVASHTSSLSIAGGLLRIDVAQQSSGETVSFSGGTLKLNNISSSWGQIQIVGSTSHLDLSAGDSGQDTSFSSSAYGGGNVTIDNWSNVANRDRILITSAPTGTFLANVNFTGFSPGSQMIGNELLPAGISPVPEPGEYACVFGLGLLAYAIYRRKQVVLSI